MKYYCPSCFKSTEYQFAKPKFCSACAAPTDGSTLAKSSIAQSPSSELEKKMLDMQKELDRLKANKKVSKNYPKEIEEAQEEEDYEGEEGESGFNIPTLRPGAGVTIERNSESSGVSLGSIVEQASKEGPSPFPQLKRDKINKSKKQILAELSAEASSAAKRIEIK